MQFKDRIKEGLDGKYQGLKNGLSRINKYLFYTQRACYYLIGGLSGSAKTTFLDFVLLNAIQDAEAKGMTINIFYYSYEIREEAKKANWMSVIIYNKYDRIIPPERIMGLGDERLSAEEQEIVNAEQEYLDNLFSKIMWRWQTTNPTGMYKEWWDFMKDRGTFEYEEYIDENNETQKRIIAFIPTNPNEYNITAIDHLALLKRERGFDLKANIDKISEYAVTTRNLFGMTHFFLQQFNQGLNSVDRMKFKGADISPQQSDFKDSTNPYADADVVLGLMNAHKMDMETCLGYNINVQGCPYNLKSSFRMLKIVKNRLSRDDKAVGLLFKPQAGYFSELPLPSDMTEQTFNSLKIDHG